LKRKRQGESVKVSVKREQFQAEGTPGKYWQEKQLAPSVTKASQENIDTMMTAQAGDGQLDPVNDTR